jgi:hypothetical protein
MVSNKILNTLRNTNRVILTNTIASGVGGNGPDEFGNQYWSFMTLQSGIDYFTKLNDIDMIDYLRDCVKLTSINGMCSEQDVLSEPCVFGYNPKHDALTSLTKRALDSSVINRMCVFS